MSARRLVWTLTAALAFSGSALAQGMMGMGMHGMMMGEGDQKVSKEAFLKHAEARFARMDANKDGVIDATDRAAMRKRMQDCMGMMDGGMGGMGGGMQGAAAAGAGQDHEAHHPKP
ncbi:hypothetical protein P9775_005125 [Pseudomonas aeruginosa]|uniref:hypothetical protein n=1 Tax=Pseudomonas aeruginosa TaxID=287 RepID=UPI0005BDC0A2|nr:hypothetical protein [Pseudomonas aeruginosa]EIZ0539856.1 hypothetical protein [Pseudomonas aeruginosa]EKV4127223.1 hypothetical protein [Pseudomonas aeruginosa]EKW0411101.1 hypothetical protein [Pseudomonas aeruginosa]EKW1417669.1 hypothetical protein [Pseudomonas aeruginosa]EKW1532555.1 hypothetical protein [Pseudomonas aeruginosa]